MEFRYQIVLGDTTQVKQISRPTECLEHTLRNTTLGWNKTQLAFLMRASEREGKWVKETMCFCPSINGAACVFVN